MGEDAACGCEEGPVGVPAVLLYLLAVGDSDAMGEFGEGALPDEGDDEGDCESVDEYGLAAAAAIADTPIDDRLLRPVPLAGRIFMPPAVGDCTGAFMIRRACAEAAAAEGAADDMVPDARRGGGVDTADDADDAFNAGDEDGETRGRLEGEEAADGCANGQDTVSRVLARCAVCSRGTRVSPRCPHPMHA